MAGQAGSAGCSAAGDQTGRARRMIAITNPSPRVRILIGSAFALLCSVAAEVLVGLWIEVPLGGLMLLTGASAAGLAIGCAGGYRTLGTSEWSPHRNTDPSGPILPIDSDGCSILDGSAAVAGAEGERPEPIARLPRPHRQRRDRPLDRRGQRRQISIF